MQSELQDQNAIIIIKARYHHYSMSQRVPQTIWIIGKDIFSPTQRKGSRSGGLYQSHPPLDLVLPPSSTTADSSHCPPNTHYHLVCTLSFCGVVHLVLGPALTGTGLAPVVRTVNILYIIFIIPSIGAADQIQCKGSRIGSKISIFRWYISVSFLINGPPAAS